MKKKTKDLIPLSIYDKRCGDCYYNVEGLCKHNPAKCVYNQPPKTNEEEEIEDE